MILLILGNRVIWKGTFGQEVPLIRADPLYPGWTSWLHFWSKGSGQASSPPTQTGSGLYWGFSIVSLDYRGFSSPPPLVH